MRVRRGSVGGGEGGWGARQWRTALADGVRRGRAAAGAGGLGLVDAADIDGFIRVQLPCEVAGGARRAGKGGPGLGSSSSDGGWIWQGSRAAREADSEAALAKWSRGVQG